MFSRLLNLPSRCSPDGDGMYKENPMSTLTKTNLEVSFNSEDGTICFTQHITEKWWVKEYPSWPWSDLVLALGFYDDVVHTVDNEVKMFHIVCDGTHPLDQKRTIALKFKRRQTLPPASSENFFRCANAWLKIEKDEYAGTLTLELHRVPGSYKDFVLLDTLDHLEGRAGRGRNMYVDGRPGVLRQKLERALQYGPHQLTDPNVRPEPIADEERIYIREH